MGWTRRAPTWVVDVADAAVDASAAASAAAFKAATGSCCCWSLLLVEGSSAGGPDAAGAGAGAGASVDAKANCCCQRPSKEPTAAQPLETRGADAPLLLGAATAARASSARPVALSIE
jgi:hypothetical protein